MSVLKGTLLLSLALSACGGESETRAPEQWELESEFVTPTDGYCWDVLVGPRGVLALDSRGDVTELLGLAPGTAGKIWRNVLADDGVTMWIQTNSCVD